MKLSENLRRLRKARGVTQEQVALAVGVHRVIICQYEQGVIAPRLTTAVKLAELFGVTVDELIGTEYEGSGSRKVVGDYQSRVIRAAINHRVNGEINRLSAGMNIRPERVREIWKESVE